MAFPDDPRDLKIGFAFGSPASADPTGLTYEQISPNPDDETDPGPVLGDVTITCGRPGDSGTTQPTKIETGLRNTDGEFSPRNVSSPRYGTLRKGTPMQVQVDAGSGDVVRARAAQPHWDVNWDGPDINDRVPIEAYGILSRLGRDRDVKSALRGWYETSSPQPTSYWALDAGELSTVGHLTSGVGGPFSSSVWGTAQRVEPGTSQLAPWLGTGLLMRSQVVAQAQLNLPGSPSRVVGECTFVFVAEPDQLCTASLILAESPENISVGQLWIAQIQQAADNTLSVVLSAFQDAPAVVFETISAPTVTAPGPHHLRLDLEQSGSNIAWRLYLDGEELDTGTASSLTLAQFQQTRLSVAQDHGQGIFGHVAIYVDQTPPDIGDVFTAALGNISESASDRITRLCSEAGISVSVTAGDTALMGPQRAVPLLELLRECEAADHGILYERTDGQLGYKPLSALYNLDVDLALDYGTEVEPGNCNIKPIDDDRDVYNLVTVTRGDGSSATAEQSTGPVGTDEAEGIGPRPLPVTLNLATDDQVAQHASWVLHETTTDQPRWIVSIDLRATPDIIADWLTCDIGSRITVANPPAQHAGPDDLDLILVGYIETLGADVWYALLYCEPYSPFNVGEIDGPGPLDNLGCETAEDVAIGETDIDVTNSATDYGLTWWSTNTPYDVIIGGEPMTVTAVSGTGASQTLTVTRTVSKTHASGSTVRLYQPIRVVLGS